ncbi:Putative MIOREX complex component 11 [Colletotrichum destructivum]|uniref:MIOREX complex component 11 n=1 Tax=Colletotrichum destructivum TaxID=34406 RepID=A0AAX4I7M5_9PEZI|nr:Putative MIOREX complex component 11 [Colletotrichum destructivum]
MLPSRAIGRARPFLRPRKPATARTTTLRTTSTNSSPSTSRAAQRLLDRVPLRFQKYTAGLRKAPLSHVVAFLVLHEITAVVPLLGLFGLFHYTDFLPLGYVTGHWAGYVRDGVGMAERYFSRKGWFGFEAGDRGTMTGELDRSEGSEATGSTGDAVDSTQDLMERWQKDAKYKVVVEVAMAWAITKALLPARILVSVWGTPWFAGVMGRARSIFRSRR